MKLGNTLIIGDSYSTFEGCIPKGYGPYYRYVTDKKTDVLNPSDTWWYQMEKENECKIVLNNSWSGSTVCHTGYNGTDTSKTSSFNHRIDELIANNFFSENEINTVIVFGGTNDSWANSPIGEIKYEGISEKEIFSVLPAFSHLFSKLRAAAPKALTVCVINCGLKNEITNGISEICNHYGITAVKLSDIDKVENHPTKKGMTEIKNQIIDTLSAI